MSFRTASPEVYETASRSNSSLSQQHARTSSWTKRGSLLCASSIVTKTSDLKMFDGICAGPLFTLEDADDDFQEYKVRILKGRSCMIGLAPAKKIEEYSGADAYQKHGWYLHQSDGHLWSQGRTEGEEYCKREIEENSVVGVRLHKNMSVSFTVDGEDQGVAFTELWDGPFKLTVLLCRENNSVELL